VRPLRQYFGEIELPPGDGDGAASLRKDLSELIRRQRFLINRTRKLTRSSSNDLARQLGTIDRMVESQSELAGLVRLLTEFLVSQGNDDVEALNQAEAAMLQASDSLAAAAFDLALIQENDALLALAEARRTLDLFLIKNPTAAQRQQMAKFSRQFRQKLRRDRPETEQEIADTLQRIAAQQMQLGQRASQLQMEMQQGGRGGSSTDPKSDPAEKPAGNSDPEVAEAAEVQPEPVEGEEANAEPDAAMADQKSEAPSLEEQQDLYAQQTELLERIQAVEDQLADRLSESALMRRRMDAAKAGMGNLASQARELQLGDFQAQSENVTDQLRELGIQLDALQETEAVSRISTVRDMTSSLSNMERKLSQQLGSGQAGDKPSESEAMTDLARLARQIKERTETIEDTLKTPIEVGDVEFSEVNNQLQEFLQNSEFLQQLQASREAAENLAEEQTPEPNETADDEAFERAVELAEASQQLDDLYQQLVSPLLARLRELEEKANQLSQQATGQGGEATEDDPELRAATAELQKDLESEGDAGTRRTAERQRGF
jgi:hypothetical protein